MSEFLVTLATVSQAVLLLLAVLLALPAAVLLMQVGLACLPSRMAHRLSGEMRRPRVAILVPAHNESNGILPTLRCALAEMAVGDRLLVVADNCADDTAALALAAGAEVVERVDLVLRGKGYALDYGVRHLAADPPDVVVVVDADCTLEPGCIDQIARLSKKTGRPVQATYLMVASNNGLKMRAAEFAMRVKNRVRPRGMHRVGIPCSLQGAGMAFPWAIISAAPLASGHLAEDMQLGVRLATAGTPPLFCEDAHVRSVFPSSAGGSKSQRTRWEHGHLSLIFKDGPRLLGKSMLRFQPAVTAMVVDMLIPPLALLIVAQLAVLAITAVGAGWGGWHLPFIISIAAFAMLSTSILVARARFASDILSGSDLIRGFVFMIAKTPLYTRFVYRPQVEWLRTERHSDDADAELAAVLRDMAERKTPTPTEKNGAAEKSHADGQKRTD